MDYSEVGTSLIITENIDEWQEQSEMYHLDMMMKRKTLREIGALFEYLKERVATRMKEAGMIDNTDIVSSCKNPVRISNNQ